ncbi:unnamed protein product [Pleuronectes platessa]|uniref:Uncharacterized protein n=1 Tax=Pleuronectes platessa TaxID=8262 RepID=A0A9N7UX35_PLEPL|nr:unnamed protein product [Pleuronectes platessa]
MAECQSGLRAASRCSNNSYDTGSPSFCSVVLEQPRPPCSPLVSLFPDYQGPSVMRALHFNHVLQEVHQIKRVTTMSPISFLYIAAAAAAAKANVEQWEMGPSSEM